MHFSLERNALALIEQHATCAGTVALLLCEDLEQLIREKLQFADTDIMRLANAQMRMCQYARSKTPLPPEEGTPGRVQISIYELAHALHAWKRQIHLHIAHTRWNLIN